MKMHAAGRIYESCVIQKEINPRRIKATAPPHWLGFKSWLVGGQTLQEGIKLVLIEEDNNKKNRKGRRMAHKRKKKIKSSYGAAWSHNMSEPDISN